LADRTNPKDTVDFADIDPFALSGIDRNCFHEQSPGDVVAGAFDRGGDVVFPVFG
jgi:hypothetical protein